MATSPTCRPDDQVLQLERVEHRSGIVVRIRGEIDLSNHMKLREGLFEACEMVQPPSPVVLDLSEVEFLASVGLSELLLCHERAMARRTPLRVVAAERRVLRPMEVTGLDRLLDLYPSLDEALTVA